jgi:hypothetical protein
MKAAAMYLSAFLILPTTSAQSAWNWSGTLRAKVQADNRYTRYVNRPEVFGEIWGSFEAFDNKDFNASLDFVTRQSGEHGFEGDIYQLYVQKEIKAWNTSFKGGGFSARIAWDSIVWMVRQCYIRCLNRGCRLMSMVAGQHGRRMYARLLATGCTELS